jgi:hypothetical protein
MKAHIIPCSSIPGCQMISAEQQHQDVFQGSQAPVSPRAYIKNRAKPGIFGHFFGD